MVVVLPAPFGPKMPVTAPRAALSVSPSTAAVWPYRLTKPPISTAGICGTVLTDASLRGSESAPCDTGHLGAASCVVELVFGGLGLIPSPDRKSTRLNSSHGSISYAV